MKYRKAVKIRIKETIEASIELQTGHVGLNVSNLERSKAFYLEVLGLQVAKESLDEQRRYAFLSDGTTDVGSDCRLTSNI